MKMTREMKSVLLRELEAALEIRNQAMIKIVNPTWTVRDVMRHGADAQKRYDDCQKAIDWVKAHEVEK